MLCVVIVYGQVRIFQLPNSYVCVLGMADILYHKYLSQLLQYRPDNVLKMLQLGFSRTFVLLYMIYSKLFQYKFNII